MSGYFLKHKDTKIQSSLFSLREDTESSKAAYKVHKVFSVSLCLCV